MTNENTPTPENITEDKKKPPETFIIIPNTMSKNNPRPTFKPTSRPNQFRVEFPPHTIVNINGEQKDISNWSTFTSLKIKPSSKQGREDKDSCIKCPFPSTKFELHPPAQRDESGNYINSKETITVSAKDLRAAMIQRHKNQIEMHRAKDIIKDSMETSQPEQSAKDPEKTAPATDDISK